MGEEGWGGMGSVPALRTFLARLLTATHFVWDAGEGWSPPLLFVKAESACETWRSSLPWPSPLAGIPSVGFFFMVARFVLIAVVIVVLWLWDLGTIHLGILSILAFVPIPTRHVSVAGGSGNT